VAAGVALQIHTADCDEIKGVLPLSTSVLVSVREPGTGTPLRLATVFDEATVDAHHVAAFVASLAKSLEAK